MRLIYEQDIENSDFIELILTEDELESINHGGLVEDFAKGLLNKRNLNVFIRMEGTCAVSQRSKSKIERGFLRKH